METNSNYIRLQGKAEIPEPLELGEGYKVILEGEIVAVSEFNNQNGSKDVAYSFRPSTAIIEAKYGKVIKARDLRSRSQQLRRMLKAAWEADPSAPTDHEKSYDDVMKYILAHAYEIYEEAKKS